MRTVEREKIKKFDKLGSKKLDSKYSSSVKGKKKTYYQIEQEVKKKYALPEGVENLNQQNKRIFAENQLIKKKNTQVLQELRTKDIEEFERDHYEVIQALSKIGLSLNEIQSYFDWDNEKAYFIEDPRIQRAVQRGLVVGTLNIANVAYNKAMGGDNEMIKFWLKSRAKWSEVFVHEVHNTYDTENKKAFDEILHNSDLREKAIDISEALSKRLGPGEWTQD